MRSNLERIFFALKVRRDGPQSSIFVRSFSAITKEFREALGTRDPKTIATYLATMRDFVAWLAGNKHEG